MPSWLHPLLSQAPAPSLGGNWLDPTALAPMAGIVLVFYFVMIRPQQKQASQQKAMLAGLKKGDAVVTQAGMFGKVVQVFEKDIVLEVSVGGGSTKVRFLKSQIAGLDPAQKAAEADKPDAKSDEKA